MLALRRNWRAGRPEFLILAGCAIAFVGQAAWLAYAFVVDPLERWPATLVLFVPGLALAIATPVPIVRWPTRTKSFVFVGALATALALLTPPGLVGGTIALAGAMWGILATYEPRPDRSGP